MNLFAICKRSPNLAGYDVGVVLTILGPFRFGLLYGTYDEQTS